jgi:aspartate aminotransferase
MLRLGISRLFAAQTSRKLCLQRSILFQRRAYRVSLSAHTIWKKVELGPPDPILGVTVAFNKDTHPNKMNLGVGAYRDDEGKPYILSCVRKAETKIYESKMDHEYAPISGLPQFVSAAAKLLLGDNHPALKENKVAGVQALSGTGALRVATNFMRRFLDQKDIYVPDPTWGNHIPICRDAGFNVQKYRYYDASKNGLNLSGMLEDLQKAPNNSIILLHACAHNPTGIDPTKEQWKEIEKVCRQKSHVIFFDSAYQGFASGDPEVDAFPIRYFIENGHKPLVTQSFAKNFGLYGERVGALQIIAESVAEKDALESQLKIIIRPMYSNPPIYGARIVEIVLNNPELKKEWLREVKGMADRIISMRRKLVQHLKDVGSKRDWSHITNQIGMFCYSGLNESQVEQLISKYHIYLTKDGRISMAGVSSKNVEYLAKAIHEVTK